jgi:hypothetical protein
MLMPANCEINQTTLSITSNLLTCNGESLQLSPGAQVTVSGSTDENSISITNSNVWLVLSSVTIQAPSPFLVLGSNLTIVEAGLNFFNATNSGSCGVGCGQLSSITFVSFSQSDSLISQGAYRGCGIGSGQNQNCQTLHIINGTYRATAGTQGGAGVGTGYSASSLTNLIVDDGTVQATGQLASGIGSGYATGGNSTVGSITISNGNITATGNSGGGIGTGYASSADSSVGTISLHNGTFTCKGTSGIGTGSTYSAGRSTLVDLSIYNGTFTVTSSAYGAGIGSGHASTRCIASVERISIHNGTFNGDRVRLCVERLWSFYCRTDLHFQRGLHAFGHAGSRARIRPRVVSGPLHGH